MSAAEMLDEHVCGTDCLPLPEWEDLPRTAHLREWATTIGTIPFFIASQLWRYLRRSRPR